MHTFVFTRLTSGLPQIVWAFKHEGKWARFVPAARAKAALEWIVKIRPSYVMVWSNSTPTLWMVLTKCGVLSTFSFSPIGFVPQDVNGLVWQWCVPSPPRNEWFVLTVSPSSPSLWDSSRLSRAASEAQLGSLTYCKMCRLGWFIKLLIGRISRLWSNPSRHFSLLLYELHSLKSTWYQWHAVWLWSFPNHHFNIVLYNLMEGVTANRTQEPETV